MKRLAISIFAASFYFSQLAQAADFRVAPRALPVGVGDVFEVPLVVDGQGQNLNAVSGSLIYDPTRLELVGVNESGSVISLWAIDPVAAKNSGHLEFSGVSTGAFGATLQAGGVGESADLLFTAKFKALSAGPVEFKVDSPEALLADGRGTAASSSSTSTTIDIGPASLTTAPTKLIDAVPPQPFTPLLARDPSLFDGAWFVSFSTTDGESAVDHYEVREGWGRFRRATSPYLLRDQSLKSSVRVRAIDAFGNARTERLISSEMKTSLFGGWRILAVLLIVAGMLWFRRRSKK